MKHPLKHPEIILDGIQVKSAEKFRKLAKALNTIEEECGIHETWITLKNIFLCPWIKRTECDNTEMEKLLWSIIDKLDK